MRIRRQKICDRARRDKMIKEWETEEPPSPLNNHLTSSLERFFGGFRMECKVMVGNKMEVIVSLEFGDISTAINDGSK